MTEKLNNEEHINFKVRIDKYRGIDYTTLLTTPTMTRPYLANHSRHGNTHLVNNYVMDTGVKVGLQNYALY